ncbi:hypothetical protein A2767_06425 [Candidatus Roizmanbacteria bacterium RIFCSPHIGHO2_01_FULL_35_10]|uniref:Thioredoxin-like fold domain-containing protein n=1 Tax=Candidatus Roizmanbacteria bacterium RIFCSPLOWO2_01_FULL_35_13 TaxID=1802055 RepID=A0A1F7I842_9BACT|nr:MAG: hypothetical protein A2767_06425 [Candidatus Roizmanbacteria bacterium RIFCSPHIGHO2_01_FULL_35_10]OGK39524.1 MAG: hypothetical protein A3A74_00715 [Candidatus Roizmanbacteria bacterium RIFCSPLOWO2_01_FULL_35_13]
MKKSNLLILLLIAVSFFAGYFFFKSQSLEKEKTQQNQNQETAPGNELKIKKPDTKEHWNGKNNVRYVWVEYSDLECPYCQTIHPNLTKLLSVYSGEIAWVFRNFPLPSHPKAQKSAEATECANELGGNDAFWKMTATIFEKMPALELDQLPALASGIGLDEAKFKTCLDSGKYEKKTQGSLEEGTKAGINSTPTSVIYDLKTGKSQSVIGALPYEDLRKSLDTFISQNK